MLGGSCCELDGGSSRVRLVSIGSHSYARARHPTSAGPTFPENDALRGRRAVTRVVEGAGAGTKITARCPELLLNARAARQKSRYSAKRSLGPARLAKGE